MRRAIAAATLAAAAAAAQGQALELFSADRFGGERIVVDIAVPDLAALRFADRTGSLVVQAGAWELCSERGHRGACAVFGPGRWDLLPGALAQRVQSVRPVEVTAGAAAPPAEPAPLTLYEHANGSGRGLGIFNAVPRLGDVGFNDIASSLDVQHGRWQLCRHSDFGGPCQAFGPGRYNLGGPLHDAVSSVRPVWGPDDQPLPPQGAVVLYRDAGWQGRSLVRSEPTPDLRPHGFNDEASSIDVLAGRWELCTNSDYGGTCRTFGPGRHGLEGPLHDGVSSLRPR